MFIPILIKWLIAYYKQGALIMASLQDVKDKLTQLSTDVDALKAVHAAGVLVPQADLDALAASLDTVDATVKALAAPPAA